MKNVMKALLVAVLAGSLLTGCIGRFALTNKVLTWNKHVDQERWINEGIFVVFLIFPVYSLTLLADGVIFNSVEWWTGKNPILAGETRKVEGADGSVALMTMRADGNIDVQASAANGQRVDFTMVKGEDGVSFLDAQGNPLDLPALL